MLEYNLLEVLHDIYINTVRLPVVVKLGIVKIE